MHTRAAPRNKTVATRDLTVLASALAGVKAYPEVVELVRLAARDPKSAALDIARIVETDVGTASDVLRVANAPASGLEERCTSLRHAVSLLGMNRVSEVVASAAALALIEKSAAQHPALAAHALAVAGVARLLAPIVGMSADEAFTLGLLHDVGALLVVQSDDPLYEGLIEQALPDEPSIEDEHALMGFDHGALGAAVLRKWNVPAPLPEAVALHHRWDDALAAGGAVAARVAVLRVASVLVAPLERMAEPRLADLDSLFNEPAVSHVGLSREELFKLWPGLRLACTKAFVVGDTNDELSRQTAIAPVPTTALAPPAYGVPGHMLLHAGSSSSFPQVAWWLGGLVCIVAALAAAIVKM